MGKVSVTPKNWETGTAIKSLLKKQWVIRYRYYDDNKGKSKQIWISDFNRVNDLEQRRQQLRDALASEIDSLKNKGWDPINKACIAALTEKIDEISPLMSFESALKFADTKIRVSEDTRKKETAPILKQLLEQSVTIGIAIEPIKNITRKHLRQLVERCAVTKVTKNNPDPTYSKDKYNRCRKVLGYYYKQLLDYEVVDANLPQSLSKEDQPTRRVAPEISSENQKKVSDYLRDKHRSFWLYLQTFYNSAPRSTEMMRLRVKDVDLKNQRIKYLIKKGKVEEEKYRVIPDIAVKYWKEVIGDAPSIWYVFGKGLKPAAIPIKSYQIHKRWRRLVTSKEEFKDITLTFYKLKHLRLTDIADTEGIEQASKQAAENVKTVKKHYDLNKSRVDENLKKGGKEF
jgi:integrase